MKFFLISTLEIQRDSILQELSNPNNKMDDVTPKAIADTDVDDGVAEMVDKIEETNFTTSYTRRH